MAKLNRKAHRARLLGSKGTCTCSGSSPVASTASNKGKLMAKNRYTEFMDFVDDGKPRKYGALHMAGNTVMSYNATIAEIDRSARVIYFNDRSYSRTTSCHQAAVRTGGSILEERRGWKLKYVGANGSGSLIL